MGKSSFNIVGNKSGNVMVMFGLIGLVLLGGVGAAVDFGTQSARKSKYQDILDSAVLSGVAHDGTQSARLTKAKTAWEVKASEFNPVPNVVWEWQGSGKTAILKGVIQ
jgi:Flp pilus assembly protein TadG